MTKYTSPEYSISIHLSAVCRKHLNLTAPVPTLAISPNL